MLLSLDNVTKTFPNGTLALDRVSFAVNEGEFVSLVGPSGCGKSTALRLVAGLIEPSAGKVAWDRAKPRLGFVFQDAALMPWATVAKNVRLPLELTKAGDAEADSRVNDALELVGLAKFAAAYPRELSGGMRMRVSIARALAMDASVLLMDEPFAALDELTRDRLNDELRELWAAKKLTIVFVTHSVYESVYLSSRVIAMSPRPGRVIADIAMAEPKIRDRDFRITAPYGERCRQVRAALQREAATP
ncbi:MAG: ABC transporter ATP-binding protein [Alphaproteobacteria bacterium]|nr:ABC transporter ATP-binding protein [Alphaproteobacteria bacterium]